MKFGLDDEDIKKIQAVFAKHSEIEKAIIYGSRAKGTYRNGSDIDITLLGKNLNDIPDELYWEIDDLLLPYMFDISIYYNIKNPDLVEHIKRVGQAFWER